MRESEAEAGGPRRPSFLAAALSTYATNVLVAVLSLVNVLIVARALGPEGRGDVALLMTIAYLTAQLASLGVQQANVNLAGRRPELRRSLASNSLVLSLAFGAAACGVVTVLVEVFPAAGGDADPTLRWVALASVAMLVLQAYLQSLVYADYGFGLVNAAWLIAPLTNVLVNGSLAAFGVLSVGTALTAWIAGQALDTALLGWFVARRLAGFGRPDVRLAGEMVGFGLRTHGGRVMLLGNFRLDQWFVGALAGSRELGLYSVAVAWAEALFFLPTALAAVLRPDLVRASGRGAGEQAAAVFRVGIVVTAVLAAALFVLAPFLCVTLFGSEFGGSVDDLRVLAPGAFGIVALKLLGSALTAQGKPLRETAAIGAGFVVTIALDLLLIPAYGGVGAAVASSAAYTVAGLAVAVIFARALGLHVKELAPRGSELLELARKLRASSHRRSGLAHG